MIKTIRYLLLAAVISVTCNLACAAAPSDVLGEVESNWPGINYQVTFVDRIPGDRLLVGVRVVATPQSPAAGTTIGFPVPIPKKADPRDIAAGRYRPHPLRLISSVMVDDLTQTKYPALPPIAPPGKRYLPGDARGFLKPGQTLFMTVQFGVPPPPPVPTVNQAPVKPTISFLFTNAKDSVKKLPLPPADTTAK